jgi:hypothetical protein
MPVPMLLSRNPLGNRPPSPRSRKKSAARCHPGSARLRVRGSEFQRQRGERAAAEGHGGSTRERNGNPRGELCTEERRGRRPAEMTTSRGTNHADAPTLLSSSRGPGSNVYPGTGRDLQLIWYTEGALAGKQGPFVPCPRHHDRFLRPRCTVGGASPGRSRGLPKSWRRLTLSRVANRRVYVGRDRLAGTGGRDGRPRFFKMSPRELP